MIEQFDDGGIRFRYPKSWKLEREENEAGWTVSVHSPETAFLMISLDTDMPGTDEMAEAALAALREEYPDLDADNCIDSIAGQAAVGHDIRFFSFDLTNTAWTRSFYCAHGTILVLCQTNDLELETNAPILRAMCASLEVETE